MKILKFDDFESIKLPIEVGDTLRGGRFKNKKIVVKEIGKDKNNQVTVNDKPLLKYRIDKTMPKNEIKTFNELCESYKEPIIKSIDDVFNQTQTYHDIVFDCLVDIICCENNISEKDFNKYDQTVKYVRTFWDNNQDILLEIDEFSSNKSRPQYCAEYLFNRYFTNENTLKNN